METLKMYEGLDGLYHVLDKEDEYEYDHKVFESLEDAQNYLIDNYSKQIKLLNQDPEKVRETDYYEVNFDDYSEIQ